MVRYAQVDDRRLAYDVRGDPEGSPVFLLHGTPGSRFGPSPRSLELDLMGVRVIGYDRPGYGRSDRLCGRRVVDAAADVQAIADDLGIERFAVVGRSGGAPHALACAAVLPRRVTAAASLVGLAPRGAEGLNWLGGMIESNVRHYEQTWRAFDTGNFSDLFSLSRNTDALTGSVAGGFLGSALESGPELPEADRRVLQDAGIRLLLDRTYELASENKQNYLPGASEERPMLGGWYDDSIAFCQDWGFKPEEIEIPVLLWHGEEDTFSPVSHSRWLAQRIPASTLVVEPGSAHFDALKVLPSVFSWLRNHVER